MKIPRFIASARWLPLLALFLFADGASVGSGSSQDKTITHQTGSNVAVSTYKDIPTATEPCTPEESAWWKRLREAGNNLQKKNDEGAKKRFYLLLYEGQQKAYRVPLKDRSHQTLVSPPRPTFNRAKYRVTGTVVLSVEFRADASVGDAQIIKGVESIVDESVIHAWRQAIFLPAVKDGAFVTERGNVENGFGRK